MILLLLTFRYKRQVEFYNIYQIELIYTIKPLFNNKKIKIRYGIEHICWHDGPQYGYSVLSHTDLKVNYMINVQINYSFLVMKSLIKNNKLNFNDDFRLLYKW